jgi:pimeloyl-ACP methyl ester carboxylesterase
MTEPLPVMLVPGLLASARLYGEQLPVLWRLGPVTIADHTRDASMAAIASRILAAAPPSFTLVGLSMGGYIALEILRQAPDRVARLALLDTTARPDTPNRPSGARPRSRWPAADASPRSSTCISPP